ncbi:MAG: hypothetical protein ACIARR_06090 [Phycisphaerales bacterium JB059]
MNAIRGRAFGAGEVKIALAAVFLVGAVSVAAWRLTGNRRPAPEGGRQVGAGMPINEEGQRQPTDYSTVRSASDVSAVMAGLAEEVARAGRSLALDGAGAERVAASARDAIEPMLLGDHEAFVEAVDRLGGVIDPGERSRLFDHLAAWMKLGEPDLSRITVRPYEGQGGGGGEAPARRVSRDAGEREGAERGPGVAERTMAMRAAGNYPEADPEGAEGPTPIEVRVPMRPKAGPNTGGEVTLGVVLVWNGAAGVWQPGMYSMTTMSVVDGEGP